MSLPRITQILEMFMDGVEFTKLIQVNDHSIAITPAGAGSTYTITINSIACSFLSVADTKLEISNGLKAAIEASAQTANVAVTQGVAPNYNVIIKTANALDPTITVGAGLADTTSDGIAIIEDAPCRLCGFSLNAANAGTITIYDGSTEKQLLPAGLLSVTSGDMYTYPAVKCHTNMGIKLAEAADVGCIFWKSGLTG